MTPTLSPLVVPAAFTVRYNGRSNRLTSQVEIYPAFNPAVTSSSPQGKSYMALYDTGATHSVVSPQVVADLQLASIGARNVAVGGGEIPTTTHLVNIGLPHKVLFTMMPVAKMILLGGIEVIVGMDILGKGDFAVTHHNGITIFSFCCPSRKEIDFAKEITEGQKVAQAVSNKVGRNDPCPCGNGKKFKKCHGA